MTQFACPRILILCTVSTWLDAVAEVLRQKFPVAGIVGVHPDVADSDVISGYTDIEGFAKEHAISFAHIQSYGLTAEEDRLRVLNFDFDVVWVAGWQRLIPDWLINAGKLGALGGHGSPDGIQGGRGRSPQNWALMLGCERFDLALFRVTPGIDDGPIVVQRSFFYQSEDDIQVSYYRASLAMADMICQVMRNPSMLDVALPQAIEGFYYPQRLPTDGRVDWSMAGFWIVRHCRALTKPYPGLKTSQDGVDVTLWRCQRFDDVIDGPVGRVSFVFMTGDFLVTCLDGRVLVREWHVWDSNWRPQAGMVLGSVSFSEQVSKIIRRSEEKHPRQRVSQRIERWKS
jgi:methionyl-tRNA formyltransferase